LLAEPPFGVESNRMSLAAGSKLGRYEILGPIGAAALLCATAALAQRMISARAAVVAYRIGPVFVDDQPVQVPYQMQDGQILKTTAQSVAELLLLPGVFLRLDQNSSFRMEDTRLEDTQVEIQEGSAFLEFGKLSKDSRLRVHFRDSAIEFKREGIYELDAREGRLRVYQGEAAVERANQTTSAKRGKAVSLTSGLKLSNFDSNRLRYSLSWAARRTWCSTELRHGPADIRVQRQCRAALANE
jgi:hypothetical protein